MLHTILRARPGPNYKLHLSYADGKTVTVDFAPLVRRGGVFAPLSEPGFFAQVSVGEHGRHICWPGELEFCADALWLQGQPDEHQAELEMMPA